MIYLCHRHCEPRLVRGEAIQKKQNGFTLVELAVVIVIISLIIAGITLGKNLIRAAEIRAITGEYEGYVSAIKSFSEKYRAMPGDFYQASNIWSSVSDGDGDGLIEVGEEFDAWQHLALGKFVEGSFNGAAGSIGSYDRVPGTNVPKSTAGGGWGLIYALTTETKLLYNTGDLPPGHVLWLGNRASADLGNEMSPLLTAAEAEEIDKKLDDGLPGTGKIVAQDNTSNDCHSSATAYNITATGLRCALVFKTGF